MSMALALTVPDRPQESRPQPITRRITVRRGDTLMTVLHRARIARSEAHSAVQALTKVFKPRDLVTGTTIDLTFQPLTPAKNAPASFRGLEFAPSIRNTVGISRTWDNRFEAYVSKSKLTHEQARASGVIRSSL
jgi:hypothetical protein